MPKSSTPKPPKPPKPWERESPGRYRSSDGRFTIDQEGSGRWFVIDGEQFDEIGLARTLGPYDTLDEAKTAADEQRSAPAPESPLAERLATGPKLRVVRGGRAKDDVAPAPPAKREPPKPKPTWIDSLPGADARRARAWIGALEELGVPKAEALVRRDIEGGQPAVVTAVLARALHRSALRPPEGRELARAAARLERAGAAGDDISAYARLVAEEVVDRVLEVLSARERDQDAPSRLPGWRLIEGEGEGASGRRLILSADEVIRAGE
jgi:hypothetical protein